MCLKHIVKEKINQGSKVMGSSVYRTVRGFKAEGLKFPLRMFHGPRKGEVVWTDLKLGRVSYILRNPRYAGAYDLDVNRPTI